MVRNDLNKTVPIRPARSAVGESRILDFVTPLSAGTKSGQRSKYGIKKPKQS